MVPDPEQWVQAHVNVATKWDGQMGIGSGTGSWRERALRAEADTDAALLLAYMSRLELIGRLRELERALEETTTSLSWRLTAPLRWLHRPRSSLPTDLGAGYTSREIAAGGSP
jgi:hypothetical protein